MNLLQSKWGQLLLPVAVFAALMAIITTMPHLTVASTGMVLLREAVLIGGSIGLMVLIVKTGPISADTLGWRRPNWRSLSFGLLCLLVSAVLSITMIALMHTFGITQNDGVLMAISGRPIWMLMLFALTAAISEEIIFRGIILNYLAAATGRVWLGAVVSLLLFAMAHMGTWGWAQVLFAMVPGTALTLFFLWKRDLGVCMIAHFLTDVIGLLGAMMRFHHG